MQNLEEKAQEFITLVRDRECGAVKKARAYHAQLTEDEKKYILRNYPYVLKELRMRGL